MDNPFPPPPLNFPSCKIAKLAIPQLPKHDSTARMASKETKKDRRPRLSLDCSQQTNTTNTKLGRPQLDLEFNLKVSCTNSLNRLDFRSVN
ncbi:hypothetical protein Tco_1277805 [Tanacetum coccineum]